MSAAISHHHRETIAKIFRHPASGNIEWHDVMSLLDALGAATTEHNGKVKVTLGPESETLHPHGKDVDVQTVVDLRRMLAGAGFAPAPE
jgi:hypothetical protein